MFLKYCNSWQRCIIESTKYFLLYFHVSSLKVFSGKIQPRGEEGVFEGLFQRKGNLSRLPCWLSQIGKVDKSNIKTPRRTFETPIPIIKKSSFNKLPWWSFEDMYNLDAPPRPTVSTGQDQTGIRCVNLGECLELLLAVVLHVYFSG